MYNARLLLESMLQIWLSLFYYQTGDCSSLLTTEHLEMCRQQTQMAFLNIFENQKFIQSISEKQKLLKVYRRVCIEKSPDRRLSIQPR